MIVVRLAKTADITALPEIELSASQAFLLTEHGWMDDAVTEVDAYPPLIEARTVWVAENDGVVAGFVSAKQLVAAELHVLELAVHLDHQRKGIGRYLMRAAIQGARDRGNAAVTLTTFRGVIWNAPFYRRLGFEILEEPPQHLSAILAVEADRGFTDRCAMRLAL
jgi:GNAT superfamily N-acetyltransferase